MAMARKIRTENTHVSWNWQLAPVPWKLAVHTLKHWLWISWVSFLGRQKPPDRCRFSKSRQCAGLLHRYGWGRSFFGGTRGKLSTGRVTSPPQKMHQLYNMATRFSFIDLLRLHGKNHPHLPEPLSTCLAITIPQIFRHLTPGATRTARPERLVVAPKLCLLFFSIGSTPLWSTLLLKIVISLNFFKWFLSRGTNYFGKLWNIENNTLTLWMLKNSAVLGVPNEQWSVDPDWLACIYKGVLL